MERVLLTLLTAVLLTEPVSPADISVSPDGVFIEDQSSANLTCKGTVPIVAAEWTKDDWLLVPSNRIEFSMDNTSLFISPVHRVDSGKYSCLLRYENNSFATANYIMTVYYGPDVRVLGPERVDEGSDIVLFCSVVSLPAASVTWTVNGISAGDSALLLIENSNHSHSGDYTCTAFNNITETTASAVHILTITGIDPGPGLSPGAAVGITVAVIFGLAMLAVGLYFLITYLQNSSEPVGQIPRTKKNKQRQEPPGSLGVEEEDELKTTEFKEPAQPSRDVPRAQSERPNEPVYENTKPSVPRHAKPTQLPDRSTGPPTLPPRDFNTNETGVRDGSLERGIDMNKRRGKAREEKPPVPDRNIRTDRPDSGLYATQLPQFSNA